MSGENSTEDDNENTFVIRIRLESIKEFSLATNNHNPASSAAAAAATSLAARYSSSVAHLE